MLSHRSSLKESAKKHHLSQETRRKEALQRQKDATRKKIELLRHIHHEEAQEHGEAPIILDCIHPEWMLDLPEDLLYNFHVVARPEGQRCLVLSKHGVTYASLRNTAGNLSIKPTSFLGPIFKRLKSLLPGGNSSSAGRGSDNVCILDCIFSAADSTFYVLDVLCWKGYDLMDASAEFRWFWLNSKLREEVPSTIATIIPGHNDFKFCFIPRFDCTPEGLSLAYTTSPSTFTIDGLLFYHKEGHYEPGLSPLVLLWKDVKTCRYLKDSILSAPHMSFTLRYMNDMEIGSVLTTYDGHAVASVPPSASMQSGDMLRIETTGITISDESGEERITLNDCNIIGKASAHRAHADSLSKIIFLHNCRTNPLSFESIIGSVSPAAALASSSSDPIMDVSADG